MNKKGQFVAMLGLFLILGLVFIYFYLDKGTSEVVKIYHKSSDVLELDIQAKEYEFNLNQEVKYNSFKAFNDFCDSNFVEDENYFDNFKKYFTKHFLGEDFVINVAVIDGKFKISGEFKEEKIFEDNGAKIKFKPKFEYILNYDLGIFGELYANCRNVLNCDDLKQCKVNRCSSKDNYINMEYDLKDNGFIKPVIRFKIPESVKL